MYSVLYSALYSALYSVRCTPHSALRTQSIAHPPPDISPQPIARQAYLSILFPETISTAPFAGSPFVFRYCRARTRDSHGRSPRGRFVATWDCMRQRPFPTYIYRYMRILTAYLPFLHLTRPAVRHHLAFLDLSILTYLREAAAPPAPAQLTALPCLQFHIQLCKYDSIPA